MNNNPDIIRYQFQLKAAQDKLNQEHEIRADFESLMSHVIKTGDYIYLKKVQLALKETLATIKRES